MLDLMIDDDRYMDCVAPIGAVHPCDLKTYVLVGGLCLPGRRGVYRNVAVQFETR